MDRNPDGGGHLTKIRGDKDHPASQGYTCNKALRPGPLPEQPDPADLSDAASSRRQLRGNRLGYRHFGGRRRLPPHRRRPRRGQIFYYGGGGQGNHLGGAYSGAFLKLRRIALPLERALAQEKTGEAWVDAHLYGGHTRGEFEHAEVSVFVGRTPGCRRASRAGWFSTTSPKTPARSMIVIDPVLTDTAKLADFHLRVKPGADAWCLAALAAVLVWENLCDESFRRARPRRRDVRAVLADIPVADFAAISGLRKACCARPPAASPPPGASRCSRTSASSRGPNSTLCSYLQQDAVDPHRQLRQRRPASAFEFRAAVQATAPAWARRR